MRIKLVSVLVVLTLSLLAMSATPSKVAASCTGYVCGCDTALYECLQECSPGPDGDPCERGCRREHLDCSICCCESQHPRCQ